MIIMIMFIQGGAYLRVCVLILEGAYFRGCPYLRGCLFQGAAYLREVCLFEWSCLSKGGYVYLRRVLICGGCAYLREVCLFEEVLL